MIIDFHAHSFPERIAKAALDKLAKSSDSKYYLNGTLPEMIESSKDAGIDYSVLLPVATNPKQEHTINETAIAINEEKNQEGIYSFGGIHPDNDNYKEIINNLYNHGIKGIKLHPVFQGVKFNDIRYKRIVSYASEKDMLITIHGGYDISFPNDDSVTPDKIVDVLDDVAPTGLIIAHMGGWNCWDMVDELLVGRDVWFDTAFTISDSINFDGAASSMAHMLDVPHFLKLIRAHGSDKILFGTDTPWTWQEDEIKLIKNSGLTEDELEKILYKNAAKLLNLHV